MKNSGRAPLLCTYTIYHVRGFAYVCREFMIDGRGNPSPNPDWIKVADTLDGARDHVPAHADYRIPRDDTDDPSIIETWL